MLIVCSLLVGCGGGEGNGSGASAPPATTGDNTLRIAIAADQLRGALPSGVIGFTVAGGPVAQAACSLDGAPAVPCLNGADSGEIYYEGLGPGHHGLSVEIRAQDGSTLRRADQVLEIVAPDVVVFGATPGGIAAAIAAAESSKIVAVLEPTQWVGGMMSGGLAKTDLGPKGHEIIGGWAATFFARLREVEIAKGACGGNCQALYDFEPHEAERTFEDLLAEARVVVERSTQLVAVVKEGSTLRRVVTTRGPVAGEVFIDASYEGDLMALAGVSYALGREPRVLADPPDDSVKLGLQEDDAGTLRYRLPRGLHVDPYRVPGDPSSGTLPYLEPRPQPIPATGVGDSRVMAYTYRLCVTDDPSNRVPFAPPVGYDPAQYEASARLTEAWIQGAGIDPAVTMFNPAPTVLSASRAHYKHDLNGGSTFSIDMTAPNLNQAYVLGDEALRQRIRGDYQSYIRGLLYFWQTDPRFGALNQKVASFGYCLDEFTDRGGWPHQLYVRAARRMLGEYVMNQNDVMQNGRRAPIADPVGLGSYNIDVHSVRYMAAPVDWPDGTRRDAVVLEGFLIRHAPNDEPYPVSYRALVPRAAEATNLLNPVTLSATHVAYASLRMEPTLMILGEAAGVAAALAVDTQQPVQTVDYATLRRLLLARGQRLSR